MTTTTKRHLEVDPYLRDHTELLVATEEAIAYLDGREIEVPGPAAIRWRYIPTDEPQIELSMSDSDDWSGFVARHKFPVRQLTDPVSRDIWALRVFGSLIDARLKKSAARVNELWSNFIRDYDPAAEGIVQ